MHVVISLIQIPRGEKIIAKPAQRVWWLWDGSHWQRVKAKSHPWPLCSHAREERSAALPGRFPSPHGYTLGLGSLHKYFKHADKSPAVAAQHYMNTWLPVLSGSLGIISPWLPTLNITFSSVSSCIQDSILLILPRCVVTTPQPVS